MDSSVRAGDEIVGHGVVAETAEILYAPLPAQLFLHSYKEVF